MRLIFILLLLNFLANAQLYIHEPFDYADLNPLDWATGGAGWSGEWTRGTGDDIIVRAENLPYLNLNDSEGNYLAAHYEVVGLRYHRPLVSVPDTGQVIWIAFLMREDEASNPNSVSNITLTKGGNQVFSIGKKFGNERFGLVWPNAPNYNSTINVEGLHWVVTKLQFSGNNQSESAWMWIDPDPESDEPLDSEADLAVPQPGMTDLNINFGFDGVQVKVEGNGPVYADFDELRIGTSFTDVNPFASTSIEQVSKPESILVYPNPTRSIIHLDLPEPQEVTISLFDTSGKLVRTFIQQSSESNFRLPDHLSPGVYLIEVRGKDSVWTETIVVQP